MKARLLRQDAETTMDRLLVGQLAIITDGCYRDNIIYRNNYRIVCLSDPCEWEHTPIPSLPIRILKKGEIVLLEVDK